MSFVDSNLSKYSPIVSFGHGFVVIGLEMVAESLKDQISCSITELFCLIEFPEANAASPSVKEKTVVDNNMVYRQSSDSPGPNRRRQ